MRIVLDMTFDEDLLIRLAGWLTDVNCHWLTKNRAFPSLYASGVIYQIELVETWSDAPTTLLAGHEDCDALACWRAAELLARGWQALRPWDPGYALAKDRQTPAIKAEVYFTAGHPKGQTGTYHCLVRYQVGGVWYTDDPSARLGMHGNTIDPLVWAQWEAAGVRNRVVAAWKNKGVHLVPQRRAA